MGFEEYMLEHHPMPKKQLSAEFKSAKATAGSQSNEEILPDDPQSGGEGETGTEEEAEEMKVNAKATVKKQRKRAQTPKGMKDAGKQKTGAKAARGQERAKARKDRQGGGGGLQPNAKRQKQSKKKKKRKRRRSTSSDSTSGSGADSSDDSSSSGSSTSSSDSSTKKRKKKNKKKNKKKKKGKRMRVSKPQPDDGYKAWAQHQAKSVEDNVDFNRKAKLLLKLQAGGTKIKSNTAAAVMRPALQHIAESAPTQRLLGRAIEDKGDEGDGSDED
jgi:hypothetical protein